MFGESTTGERWTVRPATPMRRVAAWLVDHGIGVIFPVLIALNAGVSIMGFGGRSALALIVGAALFLLWIFAWFSLALKGQTIGKAVAGLVVVHSDTVGNPPFGIDMMIVRAFVKAFMLGTGIRFRVVLHAE